MCIYLILKFSLWWLIKDFAIIYLAMSYPGQSRKILVYYIKSYVGAP